MGAHHRIHLLAGALLRHGTLSREQIFGKCLRLNFGLLAADANI